MGGFRWSSQRAVCWSIVEVRQVPLSAFSIRVSCAAATPPPVVAVWSIARRQLNGTPSAATPERSLTPPVRSDAPPPELMATRKMLLQRAGSKKKATGCKIR